MRGMIKWKPFNTLLNKKDINLIKEKRLLIEKPIIMEDMINEINYNLINAFNNNFSVEIKHFNKGTLKLTTGKIEKINNIEKYILINNTRIYFKNLLNLKIL